MLTVVPNPVIGLRSSMYGATYADLRWTHSLTNYNLKFYIRVTCIDVIEKCSHLSAKQVRFPSICNNEWVNK